MRHGRVTHHAFVRRKRAKLFRSVISVILFDVGASSFGVHVSSALFSRRHESLVPACDVPEVLLVVVLDVYPKGSSDTSLLFRMQTMFGGMCGMKR